MKKPNLQKGRIYLKQGKWMVRQVVQKRVKGGSPKQLGSYNTVFQTKYYPILPASARDLKDPYDQGKETCFELVSHESGVEPYAKLWPTSKMAQDLQYYLETTPQEKIDEDWKKVEELDLVGPTVEEFLGIEEQHNFLPGFINQFDPKEGEINGEEWTAVHFLKWLELNKFKIVK